ncbi:hypothetical protein [Natrinema ejinorense]|uniref:Roadblock/LAMTOR2 domain-containing protein n=1 Tax=Natrinema ejinorense TaxID=373386 RepID=A0A2A5QX93_9EURY|nr:hypothetical protein [Natrinema ejinorense]PCR91450.1 hypothetical protein CP557_13490 [Natrinema ejinorense]
MGTIENTSTFAEFDADAVLEKLREIAGGQILTVAEYDAETYNIMYMDDQMGHQLGDAVDIEELADRIHSDYRLDFTEKEMYEDVYSELGEVRAFAVFFEGNTIFRFVGETTGLYVSLTMDAPFNAVIEAVSDIIEDA